VKEWKNKNGGKIRMKKRERAPRKIEVNSPKEGNESWDRLRKTLQKQRSSYPEESPLTNASPNQKAHWHKGKNEEERKENVPNPSSREELSFHFT